MKYLPCILVALLITLTPPQLFAQKAEMDRERILFDASWKFAFGNSNDVEKDFNTGTRYFTYLAKAGYADGAASPDFDDRAWRPLNLPHDWVVEQPFSPKGSHSHGYKAAGPNFPETSVGWYRKTFQIEKDDFGKQIFIDFDGVSRDAKIWVNGFYLGNEPSGYQSFSYNITDILNYGGENVVAVRADISLEEGWYYEGGGIYRHVWLRKTNPVHIPKDGTYVHTQVKGNEATVYTETEVVNKKIDEADFQLQQTILDGDGNVVKQTQSKALELQSMERNTYKLDLSVENAHLWSLEDPYLYQLKTEVLSDGKVIDAYTTSFGIRTIRFDADKGFFLNGKHVKLKGTNNHQGHAGVGVALPNELNKWRLLQLKAFGSNAYRCSHNPPTPELLDYCDSLGILVIDENRLMGSHEEALHEVERMIKRDRNHPSVIVWSLGNEEWTIEGNEKGAWIASTMQQYAHLIDPTRPTNAAISGGREGGISKVIEIMGYNYLGLGGTDEHHKNFPNQPSMGTEEGSTHATRGEYFTSDEKQYKAAYDNMPRENWYSIEDGWRYYAEREYLAGMFIWTGFDYRGESTPYTWPSVTSYFGMMDLCGFPKDNVFYLKSWWQEEPVLHILPHWNWPDKEGDTLAVWVYSNCEEVELFLNKKSLGKKKMPINGHLEWQVKYHPGQIKAIGYTNGKKVLTKINPTTGSPGQVDVSASKASISGNGRDVSVITVRVKDKKGHVVPTAQNDISFSITGPGHIIGVGNGNPTSHEKERFIDQYVAIQLPELDSVNIASKAVTQLGDSLSKENLVAFRGSFSIDSALHDRVQLTWFYNKVANNAHIYLNGQLLTSLKEEDQSEIALKKEWLRQGENEIIIIGAPLQKKNDWDVLNRIPGTIQMIIPAKPWQRKLFNGLAQVIIQSDHSKGKVELVASSPALKPAKIEITVK